MDGWVLLRENSGAGSAGAATGPSGYGRSQAGAVLRYRLMSGDRDAPFVYGRANKALVPGGETEVAAGVGLTPVPKIPVTVHGEARLTDFGASTTLRPALYAVLGPPPIELVPSTTIEIYAQAGYVGGRDASTFADGQARVERKVVTENAIDARVGIGLWGGAQEGAARLDVGPTASVRFALGEVPVRVSLDYRERVAGNAEPGSGLALTVSGGF